MPVFDETKAREILDPFHARIRAVVERAWAEHRAVVEFRVASGFGTQLYRRTVSNDVFDAIVRHAALEFGSDNDVYIRFESQTLKIFFGSLLVARFKRGDRNKLGRNIPTQAVMDFVTPEGHLPGLPPEGGKVEFVWMSNDIQTTLEDVYVTARDGNRLVWSYALDGAGGAEIVPFEPKPAPSSPADHDTADMVTPKRPSDDKKTGEE